MNNLQIDVSPRQLSRLRNGHKVRIRKGTGFNLVVNPNTYNTVSRSFKKDKGIEVALSPEEIEMNREQAPQMEGQGIFGKKFDKLLKKAGIKKIAYKAGDALKPMIKEGIDAGLMALGPEAAIAGAPLKEMLYGAMDKPSDYGLGGSKADKQKALRSLGKSYGNMANQYATEQLGFDPRQAYGDYRSMTANPYAQQGSMMSGLRDTARQGAMDYLSQMDGSNTGYMGRAGYGSADANAGSDFWANLASQRKYSTPGQYAGNGLLQDMNRGFRTGVHQTRKFVGAGLIQDITKGYHSGMRKTRNILGSGMLSPDGYYPQALTPQPFSANFHMQNMLPPQYRRYETGGEYEGRGFGGAGLYL